MEEGAQEVSGGGSAKLRYTQHFGVHPCGMPLSSPCTSCWKSTRHPRCAMRRAGAATRVRLYEGGYSGFRGFVRLCCRHRLQALGPWGLGTLLNTCGNMSLARGRGAGQLHPLPAMRHGCRRAKRITPRNMYTRAYTSTYTRATRNSLCAHTPTSAHTLKRHVPNRSKYAYIYYYHALQASTHFQIYQLCLAIAVWGVATMNRYGYKAVGDARRSHIDALAASYDLMPPPSGHFAHSLQEFAAPGTKQTVSLVSC